MSDEIKIAEDIVLLLFGVDDKPIKGDLHLQKEIFLLTKSNPKLQNLFNFKKHIFGPYSQLLADIVEEPLYHDKAFMKINSNILLTPQGRSEFKKIKSDKDSQKIVDELEKVLSLIRSIYDKLSGDELLFLIYATYPEYLEKSAVSDKLFKNKSMKKRIVSGLLSKGVITESRASELLRVEI
jgi:uncharacterized protein YwgA